MNNNVNLNETSESEMGSSDEELKKIYYLNDKFHNITINNG